MYNSQLLLEKVRSIRMLDEAKINNKYLRHWIFTTLDKYKHSNEMTVKYSPNILGLGNKEVIRKNPPTPYNELKAPRSWINIYNAESWDIKPTATSNNNNLVSFRTETILIIVKTINIYLKWVKNDTIELDLRLINNWRIKYIIKNIYITKNVNNIGPIFFDSVIR